MRALCGLGRNSLSGFAQGRSDELRQPLPRQLAVAKLAALGVDVDHEHALRSEAMAEAQEQPLPQFFVHDRRVREVPVKGHARVRLVDVLTAWPSRAARREPQLVTRDEEIVADWQSIFHLH